MGWGMQTYLGGVVPSHPLLGVSDDLLPDNEASANEIVKQTEQVLTLQDSLDVIHGQARFITDLLDAGVANDLEEPDLAANGDNTPIEHSDYAQWSDDKGLNTAEPINEHQGIAQQIVGRVMNQIKSSNKGLNNITHLLSQLQTTDTISAKDQQTLSKFVTCLGKLMHK
ncbi:hypothetical protein FRC07_001673, partial [Ceratobasidium sp. 392]